VPALANLSTMRRWFAARRTAGFRDGRLRECKVQDHEASERKSNDHARRNAVNTAYSHPVMRSFCAFACPNTTDPVHTVTVIPWPCPRVTMPLPEGDRYSLDNDAMLSTISGCSAPHRRGLFMHQI